MDEQNFYTTERSFFDEESQYSSTQSEEEDYDDYLKLTDKDFQSVYQSKYDRNF